MTEVPFQPRGDRPVYCSSCYNKIKGAQTEAEQQPAEAKAEAAPEPDAAQEPTPDAEGDASLAGGSYWSATADDSPTVANA